MSRLKGVRVKLSSALFAIPSGPTYTGLKDELRRARYCSLVEMPALREKLILSVKNFRLASKRALFAVLSLSLKLKLSGPL